MLALATSMLLATSLAASGTAWELETRTTGYLDTRVQGARVVVGGLLPSEQTPSLANTTEGNLQLNLRFGEHGFVFTDASLFWQTAGFYWGEGVSGERVRLSDQDVAAWRPAVVVSELYGSWNLSENAHLTLGKKRVVWGPAMLVNPTDVINPLKDPTDPASQRTGAWLARFEMPFERFTVTALASAKVLRQYGGLPSALLYHPDYPTAEAAAGLAPDDRDRQPHFAASGRLYALVADTDLNLVYTFTNAFNDAFLHKNRLGFSASRVFGNLELHVEAMGQLGSSRLYFDRGCTGSTHELMACVRAGRPVASRDRLDATDDPRLKAVVGGRYMFEDGAMLTAEYFFNGEGYAHDEFQALLSALASARELSALTPGANTQLESMLGRGSVDPGSPQKLAFDPLRRHYLFANYQKPQVADDFTLGASVLLSLADLSGMVIPSVSWSAREWLTLSASVYAPLPAPEVLKTEVRGAKYSEFGLQPSDWRAIASARAWF